MERDGRDRVAHPLPLLPERLYWRAVRRDRFIHDEGLIVLSSEQGTLRDLDRERAFLVEAGRGHEPFVSQATARLTAGDETFGSSWAWIGIRRHLAELLEEATGLGAWAVLATQALDREQNLSDVDRQRLASMLAAVAEDGARAHRTLTAAVRCLGDGA